MKKNIIVNIIPFIVWILTFICDVFNVFEALYSALADVGILIAMPIIFLIINYACAKTTKQFLVLNGIFTFANLSGYLFEGLLYYSFISNDSSTILVIKVFFICSLLYCGVLTLIGYVLKYIKSKK